MRAENEHYYFEVLRYLLFTILDIDIQYQIMKKSYHDMYDI